MIKIILIHNLIYLEHVGKWLISRSSSLSPQIQLKPLFPGISQIWSSIVSFLYLCSSCNTVLCFVDFPHCFQTILSVSVLFSETYIFFKDRHISFAHNTTKGCMSEHTAGRQK